MNYRLILLGNGGDIANKTLGDYHREPFERPAIGHEIEVKGRKYRVASATPASNPDNITVTYFLEPLNPNRPYKAPK